MITINIIIIGLIPVLLGTLFSLLVKTKKAASISSYASLITISVITLFCIVIGIAPYERIQIIIHSYAFSIIVLWCLFLVSANLVRRIRIILKERQIVIKDLTILLCNLALLLILFSMYMGNEDSVSNLMRTGLIILLFGAITILPKIKRQ